METRAAIALHLGTLPTFVPGAAALSLRGGTYLRYLPRLPTYPPLSVRVQSTHEMEGTEPLRYAEPCPRYARYLAR